MSKIGSYILDQLEKGRTMEDITENGFEEQATA